MFDSLRIMNKIKANRQIIDNNLDEFSVAAEVSKAKGSGWSPKGKTKDDQNSRKILVYLARLAKFAKAKELENTIGSRSAFQRVMPKLLGVGLVGKIKTKKGGVVRKTMPYMITTKGLNWLKRYKLIDVGVYQRAKTSKYARAMDFAAKFEYKAKVSTKQAKQTVTREVLGDIASNSSVGLKTGSTPGNFGFHRKNMGSYDVYSITVTGTKAGARWKLLQKTAVYINNKKLPPFRVLVNPSDVLRNIAPKIVKAIPSARGFSIKGYQADIKKPDDIIILFQTIPRIKAGISGNTNNLKTPDNRRKIRAV